MEERVSEEHFQYCGISKTEVVVPAPAGVLGRWDKDGRPVAGSKPPDGAAPCCLLPLGSSGHLCWRCGNHLRPVIYISAVTFWFA